MFTMGGKVAGGKMHGTFPSLDLASARIVDPRRGSLIPSTPWEGIWKPIAQWFGVEDDQMLNVLPNLINFPESHILKHEEVFHDA